MDELDDYIFQASHYLARVTLDSLGEIFSAANQIKEWLAECAKLVWMVCDV